MAGGAEVAVLAGKCKEVFITTVLAPEWGKSTVGVTVAQIPFNDFSKTGAKKPILMAQCYS
jgi:hypothetical protein